MNNEFLNKIRQYVEYNEKKKEFDKKRKSIGKEIQEFMQENDLDKFENEEVRLNLITRTNQDIEEDELLEVLKEHDIPAIKESPDIDKLEQLIDNNELSQKELDKINECIKINSYSYVRATKK